MKISIAMATYNGAKYLQEQLNSFTNQTRLPDELIVCDDGSSDKTIDILKRFSQVAPFKINIFYNKKNIGYVKNFEKALSLCSGDYIFLSDQDDIWFENKLELVLRHFNTSGAQVVINDIGLSYFEHDKPVSVLKELNKKKISEDWFINGCATAITNNFKEIILPFPSCINQHDAWINNIAIYTNVRSVLPIVLQIYRRHEVNTSTYEIGKNGICKGLKKIFAANKNTTVKAWLKMISQNNEYLVIMNDLNISHKSDKYRYLVSQSVVYEKRIFCISTSRIKRIKIIIGLFFSGQYKHVDGWRSAAFDFLIK